MPDRVLLEMVRLVRKNIQKYTENNMAARFMLFYMIRRMMLLTVGRTRSRRVLLNNRSYC